MHIGCTCVFGLTVEHNSVYDFGTDMKKNPVKGGFCNMSPYKSRTKWKHGIAYRVMSTYCTNVN